MNSKKNLIHRIDKFIKNVCGMRLNALVILLLLYCIHPATAQIDSAGRRFSEWRNYYSMDTSKFNSRKIRVVYTLERTNNLKDKFFRKGDLIFNDSVNRISKLFIINEHYQVDSISTIPIDNIIIDDSKELILCLSRAEVSPYHIVLYNFQGELLFKKKISPFELVLDSTDYIQFRDSFPGFFEYAITHKEIMVANNLYYVDLNYWHYLSENQKEKIKQSNWLKTARYFNVFPENFDGTLPIELSKYAGFYSQTDPLYEFEISNTGHPIGIVLNDEYHRKVKIPLDGYVQK